MPNVFPTLFYSSMIFNLLQETSVRFEVLSSYVVVYDANMPVIKMDLDKINDLRRNMK